MEAPFASGLCGDFIPQLVSKAVDSNYVDSLLHADGNKAMQTSKDLATKEGIFTGTSGGGFYHAHSI